MKYSVTFPCGAGYHGCKDDPRKVTSHTRPRDGAIRLCVYDSDAGEGELQRPTFPDGTTVAPCRFNCPAKRAGGRKETRCFPADEHPEVRDATGGMRWRWVVTCYGLVAKLPAPPADRGETC